MNRLFQALSIVPLAWLHGLGWLMGWATFLVSGVYRQRFLKNARRAGYGWRSWGAAIGQAGCLVTELPRLWLGRLPPIRWTGDVHIAAALQAGRGIVFLTPHLGCFEITARAYAQRYGLQQPMTVLFRPARQPWLRSLIATARQRPGLKTAPTSLAGVKQMIKALRQGQVVGLLPDQVPPLGMGVWAPFLGQAAYTMTLSARLVQQTGATVLLAWGERLAWGQGYSVHVQPLTGTLPADPVAAATCINAAMEGLIRDCPGQYLWGYARYKEPVKASAETHSA
jgi:Kdo2-lipid IVA lauroyltransferase/acyltransferase